MQYSKIINPENISELRANVLRKSLYNKKKIEKGLYLKKKGRGKGYTRHGNCRFQ